MQRILEAQMVVYPSLFFAVYEEERGQSRVRPGRQQNLPGAITPRWTRDLDSALEQMAPSLKYEVADIGKGTKPDFNV